MISALARAGAVLNEPHYSQAARRAATFLRTRMWDPETRTLLRRYRDGDAAIPGFLDDYAFYVRGLLDLYETQFERQDLELAIALTERKRELFEDRENGAFFSSAANAGDHPLLIRMKDDYDGAEPSGNAIAAWNLLRLERMTGRNDLGDAGRATLRAFGGHLRSQPFGVPLMLCALDYELSPPRQIIFAGRKDAPETPALLREIFRRFQPQRAVLFADAVSGKHAADMRAIDGKTAAYVCENFTCQLPVTEAAKLAGLLQ